MKPNQYRNGYTLIQLLLVMSVAVVLMTVNVGWIHQTMKFSSVMKQRQQHHWNLTRIAWELRDDVRSSESISMDGDQQLVIEGNDGEKKIYAISKDSLTIEILDNESAIKRETLALAPNSIAYWDNSELPDWISLVVERGPQVLANQTSAETRSKDSAVDLHVRVSPNRWKSTKAKQDAGDETLEVTQ